MIFSRGRGGGKHSRDAKSGRRGEPATDPLDEEGGAAEAAERTSGPYDISAAPRGVQRLDLGSLPQPAVDGVEVRVQATPDGQIQQVVLVHGQNALQLGVFAAPRSEGIWDDVREEIRKSLSADGVAAEEVAGEYGTELRARVRSPEGVTDIRFVGVDGPRWMVRAVYQGRAAVDPASAGPLDEVMHGLVVDRGIEARPVREPLPLTLPKEMADQAAAQQAAAAQQPDEPPAANGAAPRRKPSPRPRRNT